MGATMCEVMVQAWRVRVCAVERSERKEYVGWIGQRFHLQHIATVHRPMHLDGALIKQRRWHVGMGWNAPWAVVRAGLWVDGTQNRSPLGQEDVDSEWGRCLGWML